MMSGVTLRVARASTSAMLASLLRDELLSGALPPGSPVRDTELAERANVSRGTAREALAELAREGLVVQTLHRGVRVASPTEADVADVYGARRVLEGAGLEALLASGELGALEAAARRLAAARSVPEGVEADAAFHLAIVAATGIERLVAAASGRCARCGWCCARPIARPPTSASRSTGTARCWTRSRPATRRRPGPR